MGFTRVTKQIKEYRKSLGKLGLRHLWKFYQMQTMVVKELEKLLPRDLQPPELAEGAWYVIDAGGKKIRPLFTLLSCMAVGGKIKNALSVAVACELFHTASLIHDDIIDDDSTRRGKPTLHRQFGLPMAIVTGDFLLGKGFEAISNSSNHLPPDKVVQLLSLAAVICSEACAGEVMDVHFTYKGAIDRYLLTIEKKTGKLAEAVAKAGAICGNGSKEEIAALGKYGLNIGIAYQIVDDILGMNSTQDKLGKSIWIDIYESRPNLVLFLATKLAPPSVKKKLLEILNQRHKTELEVEECVNLVKETPAIARSREFAAGFIQKAKGALSPLPHSKAKVILKEIADFVLERGL